MHYNKCILLQYMGATTVRQTFRFLVGVCSVMLIIQPYAIAQEAIVAESRVVISEVQTGSVTSAYDEYIELAVLGEASVSISGWRLMYSSSNLVAPSFGCELAVLSHVVEPGEYLLVTAAEFVLPDTVTVTATYTHEPCTSNSMLSPTRGIVTLLDDGGAVRDQFSYGAVLGANDTQSMPVTASSRVFERSHQPDTGILIDTDSSSVDFRVATTGTPGQVPQLITATPDPEPQPDPVQEPEPSEEPASGDQTPEEGAQATPPISEAPAPSPDPAQEGEPTTPQVMYLPVKLSELMIDPASPQTDANDEWVELYNPGDQVAELAGYVVSSGATFSYSYVFPDGARLEPHAFLLVTSGDTPIALANSGGAVKIADPTGLVLDSVTYGEAQTGQAWARQPDGIWSWTTTPSPNTENRITGLVPVVKAMATSVKKAASTTKKSTTATSKKATTKAAAKPKTTVVKAATSGIDTPVLTAAPTPLPGWLLALTASLAVLYGVYEYRFDMANKLWQFRRYRETRARTRQ